MGMFQDFALSINNSMKERSYTRSQGGSSNLVIHHVIIISLTCVMHTLSTTDDFFTSHEEVVGVG